MSRLGPQLNHRSISPKRGPAPILISWIGALSRRQRARRDHLQYYDDRDELSRSEHGVARQRASSLA